MNNSERSLWMEINSLRSKSEVLESNLHQLAESEGYVFGGRFGGLYKLNTGAQDNYPPVMPIASGPDHYTKMLAAKLGLVWNDFGFVKIKEEKKNG